MADGPAAPTDGHDGGGGGDVAATQSPPTVAGPTPRRAPASARPLAKGTLLGRYVLLDQIGAGGMGVVYSAYDPDLNRKVAIKLVRARSGGDQARLLREAQALARLQHPNVVALHDVGTFEQRMFLAMELVEGCTLSEWWQAHDRSWREIVSMFVAAGEGLAAAHEKQLVHRDFKPGNVLVGSDGRVRVTDFGLARGGLGENVDVEWDEDERAAATPRTPVAPANTAPDDASTRGAGNVPGSGRASASSRDVLASDLTRAGVVMGTPAYMAPETYRGEGDAAADQFGFAVSLYEGLYRQLPFKSSEDEGRWTVKKPPPGRDVPGWLHKLVLRGLAREPTERFASMRDVVIALKNDPSIRRRRIALGAGALALAGAGIAFAATRPEASAPACQGAEQKLAGIWDAARKRTVKDALAATGPVGAKIWPYLEPVVDSYATGWTSMHKAACLATRAKGEQSEEILTLRMTCLERRRVDLEALVDVFAKATAEQATKSVASAQELPPLSYCADVEALRAPVPPPADPKLRAKADALYKQLAVARVARDLEALKKVATAADELGWAPLRAEAHLTIGTELEATQLDVAARSLQTAVVAAMAANDTRTLAKALLRRAKSLSIVASTPKDLIASELERARAVIGYLDDPELRREQLLVEAFVAGLVEDNDRALTLGVAALAFAEQTAGPNSLDVAKALEQLSGAYLVTGNGKEAERSARRALEIVASRLGPDHPDLLLPMTAVASAISLDGGQFEEALVIAQRQEAIARASYGANHMKTAEVLLGKCFALSHLGPRLDEAIKACEEALAIGNQLGGVNALSMAARTTIGPVMLRAGRTREAVAYQLETVALLESPEASEYRGIKVGVIAELARILSVARDPRAVATAGQAVVVAKATDDPNLAFARVTAGQVFRAAGRLREARSHLEQAAVGTETDLSFRLFRLLWASELGGVYVDLGQADKAVTLLEATLSPGASFPGEPQWRVSAKLELARAIASSGGDRSRARGLATEALAESEKLVAFDRERIKPKIDAWLRKHGE